MENTEQTSSVKVPITTKVDPDLAAILDDIRVEEDRTMSNMIERLLKTHPRVQAVLEAEPAGASA